MNVPSPQLIASPEVRTADSQDGTVLLNARTGTYHALNPVAAFIWRRLRQGDDRNAIVGLLEARYPDVDPARLRADLDQLLERLADLEMLVSADRLPHATLELRPAGEGGPAELPPADPALVEALGAALARRRAGQTSRRRPPLTLTARAWLTLVAVDVILRGLGYRRFAAFFGRRRVGNRRCGVADVLAACTATDAAARFYFRTAWCLQRSAVAVWLLRTRGVPAQLVIGVRKLPFMAHAWVELGGLVVNDDPQVHEFFEEIARL